MMTEPERLQRMLKKVARYIDFRLQEVARVRKEGSSLAWKVVEAVRRDFINKV